MRLGVIWDVSPKSWFLPRFSILVLDPCNGKDALTNGSENVDEAFIRLAISAVVMP